MPNFSAMKSLSVSSHSKFYPLPLPCPLSPLPVPSVAALVTSVTASAPSMATSAPSTTSAANAISPISGTKISAAPATCSGGCLATHWAPLLITLPTPCQKPGSSRRSPTHPRNRPDHSHNTHTDSTPPQTQSDRASTTSPLVDHNTDTRRELTPFPHQCNIRIARDSHTGRSHRPPASRIAPGVVEFAGERLARRASRSVTLPVASNWYQVSRVGAIEVAVTVRPSKPVGPQVL